MNKTNGGVRNGIQSPMNGTNGMTVKMPSIAANTCMDGTAPKAAPMQSPTQPKNPAK